MIYESRGFGLDVEVRNGEELIYLADFNVGIVVDRVDFLKGIRAFLGTLTPTEYMDLLNGKVKE